MRTCKSCAQEKPYDASKPLHSKASGFHSTACWSCYLKAQRARVQSPAKLVTEHMVHEALQALLGLTPNVPAETAVSVPVLVNRVQEVAQVKITEYQKTRADLKELQEQLRDIDTELSLRMRKAKKALDKLPLGELEVEREKTWAAIQACNERLMSSPK